MKTNLPATDSADKLERSLLENLGQRVRMFRERAQLTRRRLALVAGVSERYLGQLEAGEGNISVVLLARVASALGTSIPELLRSEQEALAERLVRRFLRQVPPRQLEELLVRLAREIGPGGDHRRERIALIGTRGAGKSTVGEQYARELGVPFIELDREIEREAGMSLSDLFSLYGRQGFRRFERRCLERILADGSGFVVAIGGGIVSEPESYELLLSRCYTIWLKASPEAHMDRVMGQGDLRPMAQSNEAMEELRRLLKAREPDYQKADLSIDTSELSVEAVLARMRQQLDSN